MKKFVLGISGKIGSGKSTLAEDLSKRLRCSHASFGGYVRHITQKRKLQLNREVLQEIGNELINKDVDGFCQGVLEYANWTLKQNLIIDGVRHKSVVDGLKLKVSPAFFFLIHIDINNKTQQERLTCRENKIEDINIDKIEAHPTEVEVISKLPKVADLIVDGTLSIPEICDKIESWLHKKLI